MTSETLSCASVDCKRIDKHKIRKEKSENPGKQCMFFSVIEWQLNPDMPCALHRK